MIKLKSICILFSVLVFVGTTAVRAEDFQCEVMSIEGTATVTNATVTEKALKEGDILKAGDIIQVASSSFVDVGYDKDWQNVTRFEEKSKVEIKSLYPIEMQLAQGGIFAKLKALPKDSTFNVQTPTAIAAVRGTEFETVHDDEGTQVYNFSDSKVYVFGQDESGKISDSPTIVENSQMTQIPRPGAMPRAPKTMSLDARIKGGRFKAGIEKRIQENSGRGRIGKLPDIRAIEKIHHEHRESGRTGRGALKSLESGQEKNEKMKQSMNRQDQMLNKIDQTKREPNRSEGQLHQQRPGNNDQNQGPPFKPNKDRMGGSRDQNIGNKNIQVDTQDDTGHNDPQPVKRKPPIRRGGAPRPSRPSR